MPVAHSAKKDRSEPAPAHRREPRLRCFADIPLTKIDWLWDLAGRFSRGLALPDGARGLQCATIFVNAEDDPSDTLGWRLRAADADTSAVHVLDGFIDSNDKHRAFSLRDIDVLGRALDEVPDVGLVVIDPIGSYLPGVDAHRDNEVREILGPLVALAAERNVAVLIVMHTRKSSTGNADDLALGSRAFTGIVRNVWHAMPDPADRDRMMLLPGKSNNCARPKGLAYRIGGGKDEGRVEWESGLLDLSADDALDQSRQQASQPQRSEARTWLEAYLDAGEKPAGTEKDRKPGTVFGDASAAGHSPRTIRRAADEIDVDKYPAAFGKGWLWRLPRHAVEDLL